MGNGNSQAQQPQRQLRYQRPTAAVSPPAAAIAKPSPATTTPAVVVPPTYVRPMIMAPSAVSTSLAPTSAGANVVRAQSIASAPIAPPSTSVAPPTVAATQIKVPTVAPATAPIAPSATIKATVPSIVVSGAVPANSSMTASAPSNLVLPPATAATAASVAISKPRETTVMVTHPRLPAVTMPPLLTFPAPLRHPSPAAAASSRTSAFKVVAPSSIPLSPNGIPSPPIVAATPTQAISGIAANKSVIVIEPVKPPSAPVQPTLSAPARPDVRVTNPPNPPQALNLSPNPPQAALNLSPMSINAPAPAVAPPQPQPQPLTTAMGPNRGFVRRGPRSQNSAANGYGTTLRAPPQLESVPRTGPHPLVSATPSSTNRRISVDRASKTRAMSVDAGIRKLNDQYASPGPRAGPNRTRNGKRIAANEEPKAAKEAKSIHGPRLKVGLPEPRPPRRPNNPPNLF